MDFLECDPTFFDFHETQATSFGSPDPCETNPPLASIASSQLNFNFRGNMEANQPWLIVGAISIPGAQHPLPKHPEKLLPKFDPDNNVRPEDHIKQFLLSLRLMNVEHECVLCRLLPYTF